MAVVGMSAIFWLIEVAFAALILLFEGAAHFIWKILPLKFLRKVILHIVGVPYTEPDCRLNMNFMELAHHYGYKCEEHYVHTKDGYILGVHRIPPKDRQHTTFQGVVFLQHGFMQNSESWIVRGPAKALPFILADFGYDVWLGNNRGNKYSYKHTTYSAHEEEFWNFCLDDFANSDLPAMFEHVLAVTGVKSLSYIGFSQGTAQAFAAFSTNEKLTEKIKLFVALAPATRVYQLSNPIVAALTTSRPDLVFLLLGKKALLSETLFWRRVLAPHSFVALIDFSLKYLFKWSTSELDPLEKELMYSHLYSYSSVKCLVHWFQITRTSRFQMYDGTVSPVHNSYLHYVLPAYQPSKIKCPMAIFYGGKDTVPDMKYLLNEVPPSTFIHKEDNYEHLDLIWAASAPERIFKKVVEVLNQ